MKIDDVRINYLESGTIYLFSVSSPFIDKSIKENVLSWNVATRTIP